VLEIPSDTRALIDAVTNKRARFVLDAIVERGLVSTGQISEAGYDHPPRADRDVYQVLCGSCNRKRSWACEHGANFSQVEAGGVVKFTRPEVGVYAMVVVRG